jgi:hypothetical protein
LGPVFDVKNLEEVEEYFDYLAENLKLFEILVKDIDLKIFGDAEEGFPVLWIDIKGNEELRGLHNRIYKYINEHSWDTDNNDKYHFHSTIALGEQPASVYKYVAQNYGDNGIIDIGCGTGYTLLPLVEHGYDVVGLDVSHLMLDVLKNKLHKKSLKAQLICSFLVQVGNMVPRVCGFFFYRLYCTSTVELKYAFSFGCVALSCDCSVLLSVSLSDVADLTSDEASAAAIDEAYLSVTDVFFLPISISTGINYSNSIYMYSLYLFKCQY